MTLINDIIYKETSRKLKEFESNVLCVLNLNLLFQIEGERLDKIMNSIIMDFGRVFSEVIFTINKLIDFEHYELCKDLYDRMKFIYHYIFKIEIEREKLTNEFDTNDIEESFNELFQTISNYINDLKQS